MYSPAVMDGAAPSTVTRSRCPRALMRRTQKPVSALWKVTRSTRPANGSRSLEEPDPMVSIQACFKWGRRDADYTTGYNSEVRQASALLNAFHSRKPAAGLIEVYGQARLSSKVRFTDHQLMSHG